MGGKKNDLKPMWDKLMKLVDPEEPTPVSDHTWSARSVNASRI